MRTKPKLKPGWKMTEPQYYSYWRFVKQVWEASTTKETMPEVRARIHIAAFGRNLSAKEIDRLKMFDDFKAACLAILQPASVDAQLAQANMNKTRLIHRILEFPVDYVIGLLNSPRFAANGKCETPGASIEEHLQIWDEKDLTDLRNTLCARDPISSAGAGRDKTRESVRYAGTTEHPGKCVSNQPHPADVPEFAEEPF